MPPPSSLLARELPLGLSTVTTGSSGEPRIWASARHSKTWPFFSGTRKKSMSPGFSMMPLSAKAPASAATVPCSAASFGSASRVLSTVERRKRLPEGAGGWDFG